MDIINTVVETKRTRDNFRLMIPVLIHWAKTGQNRRTYGDLTHAIGKTKFSGIVTRFMLCKRFLTSYRRKKKKKFLH